MKGRHIWALLATLVLAGCGYETRQAAALTALSRNAPIGAEYGVVKSSLVAQGYEARKTVMGPGLDFSKWDECLMQNFSFVTALASGQRWLCVKLDAQGKISDQMVDDFIWGI